MTDTFDFTGESFQTEPDDPNGCLPWVIVIPAGVVFWVSVVAGLWAGDVL